MSKLITTIWMSDAAIEVWCDPTLDQRVSTLTRFRGIEIPATRDNNDENTAQAAWEGWSSVALSLVAHEVLHAFIGKRIWPDGSAVLRMLSGEAVPYARRLYEESLVMSFARWVNEVEPGIVEPVLAPTLIAFDAYEWREDWEPIKKLIVDSVFDAYEVRSTIIKEAHET